MTNRNGLFTQSLSGQLTFIYHPVVSVVRGQWSVEKKQRAWAMEHGVRSQESESRIQEKNLPLSGKLECWNVGYSEPKMIFQLLVFPSIPVFHSSNIPFHSSCLLPVASCQLHFALCAFDPSKNLGDPVSEFFNPQGGESGSAHLP